MLDRYWFGDVERISPEAPVPILKSIQDEFRIGGAGNVASNLKALGMETTLAGLIGDDKNGERLKEQLKNQGIAYCLKQTSKPTITKLRLINHSHQLLRVDFEELFTEQQARSLFEQAAHLVNEFDLVVLSDYAKGSIVAKLWIDICRQNNKPIIVDPKGSDFSLYAGATSITPNRKEYEQIVGRCSNRHEIVDKAHALIKELNIDFLVVTLSEEGAVLIYDTGKSDYFPATAKSVADVTGAGDTFIATMAASIASKWSYKDSIALANRASGIVVSHFGTSQVDVTKLLVN